MKLYRLGYIVRAPQDDEEPDKFIAEIPSDDDLVLFSEDAKRFYYGERSIDKDLIAAVRVLINGSPIAAYVSRRAARQSDRDATSFEDRPEGIARDRWDVACETDVGMVLIECGAIRLSGETIQQRV